MSDIILYTPEQVAMFRLLQIKYALRIEVNTGLRHSKGSVLKVANRVFEDRGLPRCRTKARALAQMDALISRETARMKEQA